ncbi:MAG TPA: hypothetical protein VK578_12560, partial [Edaphobacter sp.]|nr:hypothetical protein [Edaphobacter sp.]
MSKQGAVLATKKSARRVLVGATTVGVDLGDQWSHYCILDEDGEVTEDIDWKFGSYPCTGFSMFRKILVDGFPEIPVARFPDVAASGKE